MTSRRQRWLWAILVVASLTAVNPYVRGDGNGYYAWLVSPIIDGDLDFANQFAHGDPLFQTLIFEPDGQVSAGALTTTGRVGNQWSVGPAVMWAPWFLAAHVWVLGARAVGATMAADGYSWPYLWSVGIGTALYGWLALWLSARAVRRLGLVSGETLAVLAVLLASSLPVYQFFLPFHVHALSACVVAAYLGYWIPRRGQVAGHRWWLWGALAGLMVQVYQLNGVLLIVALWEWVTGLRRDGWRVGVRSGARFALAGAVVCLPQMVGKTMLYGAPWLTGYRDTFVWRDPRLWETAFSANHGLLLWTPVVLLALAGLGLVWRQHRDLRVLGLTLVVFYCVVASYQNWHGQSSFGNRFFVSLTTVWVLGVAAVADWIRRRGVGAYRGLVAVVVVLALWNAGLAFQWGTNLIPNRGPVDFQVVARQQVGVVPGRMMRFVTKYFGQRQAVIDEVEGDDQEQRPSYKVIR